MPADHSVRFDNEEDIGPAGPEAAEGGPEETVARIQGRPRSLAFEYGELLPQSEDLQGCVASRTEKTPSAPKTAMHNWTMKSCL